MDRKQSPVYTSASTGDNGMREQDPQDVAGAE